MNKEHASLLFAAHHPTRLRLKHHPLRCRITEAVKLLRKGMPSTQILVLGVLPRGTGTGKGLLNNQNDFSWPSHYAKAIAKVNAQLK